MEARAMGGPVDMGGIETSSNSSKSKYQEGTRVKLVKILVK